MWVCYLDSLEYIYKEKGKGGCCSSDGDYNTGSSPTSSMSRGLFPSLKSLYLINLKRLKGLGNRRWKVLPIGTTTRSLSFGAMPHLTAYVYIENCPQFGLLGNWNCPQLGLLANCNENGYAPTLSNDMLNLMSLHEGLELNLFPLCNL